MKLRDKEGLVLLTVRSSDSTWRVDPGDYLLRHQVTKLVNGPDLILQLARHVADDFRQRGHKDIEVYATALASLNGRKPQLLIDPTVDLASQRRTLLPSPWILPLREPLRRGRHEARASEE